MAHVTLGNVAYGCRAAPSICRALEARGTAPALKAAAALRRFVWREHCEEETMRWRSRSRPQAMKHQDVGRAVGLNIWTCW